MRKFLCTSLLLFADVVNSWSYDRCETGQDPVNSWGGKCGTAAAPQAEGSPINVCSGVPFPETAPTMQLTGYDAVQMNVINDAIGLQANVLSTLPVLDAGQLARIVGRTTSTTTPVWNLARIRFHWGRSDTSEGSDHWLHNRQYPLEAHFIHFNTAYGNSLTTAMATGNQQKKKDVLLIVGVLFDIAATESAALTALAKAMNPVPSVMKTVPGTLDLTQMWSGQGDYYAYRGSLTTPACPELVTWVIPMTVQSVTECTMQRFYMLLKDSTTGTLQSEDGNFRPLQNYNARPRYSTKATGNPKCAAITQPTFPCA